MQLSAAQMAGLPLSVVHRAAAIAVQLKARLQPAPPPSHHNQQPQYEDHREKLEGEVFQQFEQVVQQLQLMAKCSGCWRQQEQQLQQVQQHEQQQAEGNLVQVQEQLVGLQRVVLQLLQIAD